jgi:polar amino acid transport system substrate-binding protein
MKPANTIITAVILSVIAAFITVKVVVPKNPALSENSAKKESAYDRVMRTGVIRCGYIPYAPYLIKDVNTGQFSGIFHDLTEEMAKLLNLKVEWSYETTFATFSEDAKNGRYDVYCGGLWSGSQGARGVDYSMPVNFVGLGVYVRSDDNRFDGKMDILNDKQYKFSVVDGEMSDVVPRSDFPNAQILSHPNNTEVSQLALDIAGKKADAMVVEKAVADEYLIKNPGTLKNLAVDHPIRVFGNTWAVAKGEWSLLSTINPTIDQMINSGTVEKVVAKYEKTPGSFYPRALPYRNGDK